MSIGMSHFRCYYYTISVDSQVYRMFVGRYMGDEDAINKNNDNSSHRSKSQSIIFNSGDRDDFCD